MVCTGPRQLEGVETRAALVKLDIAGTNSPLLKQSQSMQCTHSYSVWIYL